MDAEVSIFQRRLWAAQRAGWLILTVLLLFAGTGALGGSGPLNHRVVRSADGSVEVSFRPVQRVHAPADLEWSVMPTGDYLRLELDSAFSANFAVDRVDPEPERTVLVSGSQSLLFPVTRESGRVRVRVIARPRRLGRLPARTRAGGDWLSVGCVALP